MRLIPSLAAVALLALPVTAMAKPARSAPTTQVHKHGKHLVKTKTGAPSKSTTSTPAPAPAPAK